MSIKHKFQSQVADGADASLVRPTNWNDDHDVTDVTLTEEAEPSSPAAGHQTLFIDSSDHKAKLKDSSGTVSSVGGGGSPAATAAGLVAAYTLFR